MPRHPHPTQKCQIFVRNLDKSTTDSGFESYFSKFGTVTFHKILRDQNGRSRGLGLVEYEQPSTASLVLEKRHHVIDGHKVECKRSRPKKRNIADKYKDLPKNVVPKHLKRIYVGELTPQVTSVHLQTYFSKFGTIENAYLLLDKDKKSKCCGFIWFDHPAAVDKVQEKRPHKIADKVVQTVRVYPEDVSINDKKPTTVLYVLNYKDGIDVSDVEDYFGSFGNIVSVSSKNKRAENLKYIELEFEDYDSIDMICLTKNHTIKNSTLTVQKYLSNSKDQAANTQPLRPIAPPIPERNPVTPCAPPLDDMRQLPYNPYHPPNPNQLYPSLPAHSATYPNAMPAQNHGNPSTPYINDNLNGMNRSRRQSNNCVIS